MNRTLRAARLPLFIPVLLLGLMAGCQILGIIAERSPDIPVAAKYKGLTNQKVAVMVWADHATTIDWPTLQLDLTRGIQSRLVSAAKDDLSKEDLKGTIIVPAESVVRYQRDHPETDAESITDVAPHMDVTRLIYVELQQFSTRPEDSLELYRGTLTANLKVVEITNGKAKIVFQEDDIKAAYPKDSPDQGVEGLSDAQVYEKTLEAFSSNVVNRFIKHIEPRD